MNNEVLRLCKSALSRAVCCVFARFISISCFDLWENEAFDLEKQPCGKINCLSKKGKKRFRFKPMAFQAAKLSRKALQLPARSEVL